MYIPVIVAVIVGLFLWGISSGADFVITAKRGAVTVKGDLPALQQAAIKEFFENDLAPQGTWKVSGTRRENGGLKLRFRGPVSPAQQQRIRNFLFVTLSH